MKTDTTEKGLEDLIVADMTRPVSALTGAADVAAPQPFVGMYNWLLGDPKSYDRA